jgi:hypothetical protein
MNSNAEMTMFRQKCSDAKIQLYAEFLGLVWLTQVQSILHITVPVHTTFKGYNIPFWLIAPTIYDVVNRYNYSYTFCMSFF